MDGEEVIKKTATVHHAGPLPPEAVKQIMTDVLAALYLEPDILALVLDSIGGTLSAELNELEEFLVQLRGKVQIICIANGSLFSAGYMLGSACEKIYTATRAARFGSIGYIIAADKDSLGKDTNSLLIYRSGIHKAQHHIDTPEENELVRAQHHHELGTKLDVMIEQIASRRGLDVEHVRSLADGRTFSADEAIAHKLIDGYYSVPDWLLHHQIKEVTV